MGIVFLCVCMYWEGTSKHNDIKSKSIINSNSKCQICILVMKFKMTNFVYFLEHMLYKQYYSVYKTIVEYNGSMRFIKYELQICNQR